MRRTHKTKPWWRHPRNRNKVWLGLLGGIAILAVAAFLWLATSGDHQGGSEGPIPVGQQVQPFELPDIVSGQTVSLDDYLGKEEIVVVGYMGFFCVACEELLVELQGQQKEFERRGAVLMVLGSVPEPVDVAEDKARSHGITYPILYDEGTGVTRDLGLWSDHMQMPWMGYVIIDRSGRIVDGEQVLSEAKGAAPENIELILSALERAQEATRSREGPAS
jgi:peroxiredoxin